MTTTTSHRLDPDAFEQARQTRDPRFDGRIFIAVLTTGIYCRPICPVRIPKKENIQIYATAAAASAAGFRPCLRCRPETAPGTPLWNGSSATVTRALQYIEQGLPERHSVAVLANKLGIGSRQLARLFHRHLGVSPVQVLRTRRLHFAKQLLDETELSMAQVCFAAGYGSVRRFNAVVREVYGTPPGRIRKRHRQQSAAARGDRGITLYLNWRPPFNWRAMLEFLAARAINGVEFVTANSYSRIIQLQGQIGEYTLTFPPDGQRGELTVRFPDSSQLLTIVQQVRRQFDLNASSSEVDDFLARDSLLSGTIRRFPGLRVPGCWDGFEIGVRAIVGQQISVTAAATLMGRIAERCGGSCTGSHPSLFRVFPDASQIVSAELSGLGITGSRIAAIQSLAAAVAAGSIDFHPAQDCERFSETLCGIRGIGPWTAQYIALRALNDPDAFPDGDLILQRAAADAGERLNAGELRQRAKIWQPWRAYAVMYLWKRYQQQLISTDN